MSNTAPPERRIIELVCSHHQPGKVVLERVFDLGKLEAKSLGYAAQAVHRPVKIRHAPRTQR